MYSVACARDKKIGSLCSFLLQESCFCADKEQGSDRMDVDHDHHDHQISESFYHRRGDSDEFDGAGRNYDGSIDPPELMNQKLDLLSDHGSFQRSNSDASVHSEQTEETSSVFSDSSSPSHWLLGNRMKSPHILSRLRMHKHKMDMKDEELEEELMKERFASLMLAGDVSKGKDIACPALAVSLAITNLYASIFTDYRRLEPLDLDSKATWRREMNFLISPCDYISECEYHDVTDKITGETKKIQVPIRPRLDVETTLPALRMLDHLLLDIMDSFGGNEIRYSSAENIGEKWWHLAPHLPPGGLSEKSKELLKKQHRRATQIHKAASVYNHNAIADMDVPDSYIEALPKSGRSILGEVPYNYILSSPDFSADHLVGFFDLSTDLEVSKTLNKLESVMVLWKKKAEDKHVQTRPSWKVVKDLVSDADKNAILARRAENAIVYLHIKYPNLAQSSLDTSKIHGNTDMGKAILETYSRVLETLAHKIIYLIEKIMRKHDEKLVKLSFESDKRGY